MDGEASPSELPATAPGGGSPRALLLFAVGLLAIPLGLILLYLAATRGEPPTPRPDVARGLLGIDQPSPAEALDGQWSLIGDQTHRMGVTVEETLADATSRSRTTETAALEGGLLIRAGQLEAIVAQADLRAMRSADGSAADLRRIGIDAEAFPLARFRSTTPVALPESVPLGTPLKLRVDGELTVHGVTRPLSIDVVLTLRNEDQVVADLAATGTIRPTDWGVTPTPDGDVRSVGDEVRIEIVAHLARRTTPATIDRGITTGATAGPPASGPS